MNTLSWLLYLADVVENCQPIFVAAAGLLLFFGGGCLVYSLGNPRKPVPWRRYVLAGVLSAFVAAAIPSKQTIYLIAASELGEKVAQTEDAKRLYEAVREKLHEVLKVAKS